MPLRYPPSGPQPQLRLFHGSMHCLRLSVLICVMGSDHFSWEPGAFRGVIHVNNMPQHLAQ